MDITTNNNIKIELDYDDTSISNTEMEDEIERKIREHKSVFNVIKSYNSKNEHQYTQYHILAVDKNADNKKFYILFKHITDKIKFIEDWGYGNLYEVITNEIVKPYFDIDYKKASQFKTDDEVKIIMDIFIKEYNDYWRKEITSDDVYVYGKRDKSNTNLWKSIHIVVDKHKVNKNAIKEWVKTINGEKKSVGGLKTKSGVFDIAIYTKNRLFSFINQRKFGGSDYFEWIDIWELDATKHTHKNITYKFLINDTDDCEFNDYHDNPLEYVAVMENKIIAKDTIQAKHKKSLEKTSMVICNQNNLVEMLLKHLPSDFYGDAVWNGISRQIVLNKLNGWENWLVESANKTDYTKTQNDKWCARQKEKFASITIIDKHLNNINEIYECCFVWDMTEQFTEDIHKWICDACGITQKELDECVVQHKKKQNVFAKKQKTDLYVGNNFTYNMRKQTLTNDLDKIILHYGLENGYDAQYGVDTSTFKSIKQDEIVETMEKFLKSINRLCGFKMLWGSGKTHYGVNTIVKYAREHNMRMLFLTENNNLNTEMAMKFDGCSHQPHHKDRHENICDEALVITSMESLGKMLNYNGGTPFNVIIFDEYESIINHLLSKKTYENAGTNPFEVSGNMKNIIKEADKIICLDCDLSETRMKLITDIFKEDNDDEVADLYTCSHNSWADYNYYLYAKKNKFISELGDDFNREKRILYATTSKTDALAKYDAFVKICERVGVEQNIMVVSAEGVSYFIDGVKYDKQLMKDAKDDLKYELSHDNRKSIKTEKEKYIEIGSYVSGVGEDKSKLFNRLESVIKELKIDVLIYTPSIKCGISFGNSETELLFDVLYGYATIGSLCGREFLQMLHRCRHLRDKVIKFHINIGLTKTTKLSTNEMVETLIDKNQEFKFNEEAWWKDNVDIEKYAIDYFYRSITITNFKEMLDSQANLSQEIMGKLKFTHNMNVLLINSFAGEEYGDETFKEDEEASKSKQKAIKRLLFQYEKKPTRDEYDVMVADKNNNNQENYLAKSKYLMMMGLRTNKSNSKYLREDRILDENKTETMDFIEQRKTSGVFKNYTMNAEKNIFFYDENSKFCDDIIWEEYDLDRNIQHSNWLSVLKMGGGKWEQNNRLMKLNNENISTYKYDADRTQSDFSQHDIKLNKLKLTKSIMDILGLDRVDLLYNRKIMTNSVLKDILDNHEDFIIKQLLYFVNKLDTESVCKDNMELKKYASSNKRHYSYVKSVFIKFLSVIGIETIHLNKCGNLQKKGYEDATSIIIFQYETMTAFKTSNMDGKILNGTKFHTYINTYYDTIHNDIHKYLFNTQRLLTHSIKKNEMTIQDKAKNGRVSKKTIERKFYDYRNITYKKNRHIKIKIGEREELIKFPHNLLTAEWLYDEKNNVIDLCNKTDDERISIWLKIELDNPVISPSYEMSETKKLSNDTRYYEYKDVEWKRTDGDYYVRRQVDKMTTNKNTQDIIIEAKHQSTEEVVGDIINDMIGVIVAKDEFKNMVCDTIGVCGEQEIIAKRLEETIKEEHLINDYQIKSYPSMNTNDTHFSIHRPNIKVV